MVAQCVLRYRSRNFFRILRMSGCRHLAQTLAEENRLQRFPRQAYCIELAETTRIKTSRKIFIKKNVVENLYKNLSSGHFIKILCIFSFSISARETLGSSIWLPNSKHKATREKYKKSELCNPSVSYQSSSVKNPSLLTFFLPVWGPLSIGHFQVCFLFQSA